VTSGPPNWNLDSERLATTRFGDVRLLDEVDSTNRVLLDEAHRGAPEGLVAVADHQTAGRGRLGRTWSAAPGTALLVSVLLRPTLPVDRLHTVGMAAGLATADGVEEVAGVRPGLKWPNDLVVDDRKLAGLLAELATAGGSQVVVLGVGINVTGVPAEVAGTATSCEAVAGRPVDRSALLAAFLSALEVRYSTLVAAGGADATLAAYRAACDTLGRPVRVELAGRTLEGTATDVAWNGQLLLTDAGGGRTAVTAGDVVHLRPG
jgi:BirA family transcriptional regulator, biotin operon repressor / biotin---[acetyl-CoA-carboxylase] ligase